MASYTISAPNGKSYTIEGPSGASQEDVQNEVIRQFPQASQTAPSASPTPAPAVNPSAPVESAPDERSAPAVPSRSKGEQSLRVGSLSAKGLVAGALAAPGELAVMGTRGIDWAGRKLWNSTESGKKLPVASSSEFLSNLDVTGTINKLLPGITPESLPERMAKAGSEMAGGMLTTGGVGGLSGKALASKEGAAALARTAGVAATGKAIGEGVGMISPTAGAVAEVLTNVIGGPRSAPKKGLAPQVTSEQRFKEAQDLYEKSKQTGVVIKGEATSKMVKELRDNIGDRDLLANKPAHQAVDYLAKHSGGGATGWIGIDLDKLMQVRRDMRGEAVGGGISQSKESKRVGHDMLNRFDELVRTMGQDQLHTNNKAIRGPNGAFMPSGTTEMTNFKEGMLLKQAADLAYTQGSKARIVEDMLTKAETLKGGTLAERYRAKMGQLIRSAPKFKQFSPVEQDAIRAYHEGSKAQKTVDFVAKFSPARGGMLPILGLATSVGTNGAAIPIQALGGLAHYKAGGMSKEAQRGMMQRILGGAPDPVQSLRSYLPAEEAVRAGMLSSARNN